jgi:SAM-dependent methyltransferase
MKPPRQFRWIVKSRNDHLTLSLLTNLAVDLPELAYVICFTKHIHRYRDPNLEEANPCANPPCAYYRRLELAPGSAGLDIGCGIGLQTLLLAEATAPDGRVTGLDISAELLDYARHKIAASPPAKQISFKQGDMHSLPFPDDLFDWVWSADCIGYPSGDSLGAEGDRVRAAGRSCRDSGLDFAADSAGTSAFGGAAQCHLLGVRPAAAQPAAGVSLHARAPAVYRGWPNRRQGADIRRGSPSAT